MKKVRGYVTWLTRARVFRLHRTFVKRHASIIKYQFVCFHVNNLSLVSSDVDYRAEGIVKCIVFNRGSISQYKPGT